MNNGFLALTGQPNHKRLEVNDTVEMTNSEYFQCLGGLEEKSKYHIQQCYFRFNPINKFCLGPSLDKVKKNTRPG